MMKKLMACLLAALMLCGTLATALAQDAAGVGDGMVTIYGFTPVPDYIGVQRGTSLTVGSNTELDGFFGTDMWGNNTATLDCRALLQGYATVASTRTLGLALNGRALSSVNTTFEANGDRTYVLEISQDLLYNNSQPITAKDYVFSVLLAGSPFIQAIGGTSGAYNHIVGYEEYNLGRANVISGVHLLSDYSFSLTVAAKYLPYFYGLAMLSITPYPMSVIAPGCDIVDNGAGAEIVAAADAATVTGNGFTPGEFSVQMLRETMMNPETGYVFNPQVTSGPYYLESYNKDTHTAAFRINEVYLGNYEGQKPHIESIIIKPVKNDTMITEMQNGEVDLLNKVSNIVPVTEGLDLADVQQAVQRVNYPRTGFAFLSFACEDEEGPTSHVAVRKAISLCFDKQELVNETVGASNGIPVYGYYGLGQWMLQQNFARDEAAGKEELLVSEAMGQFVTNKDMAAAEQLLVDDGWVLNETGAPFTKGTDKVRYADIDGTLTALQINWAKSAESASGTATENALRPAFEELGIALEVTEMPFSEMLRHYYRQKERTYNMFFLATNFEYIFDPYYTFNTNDIYQGLMNTTGLRDEELMARAWAMRVTPTNEMRTYVESWLAFQARWVDVMPMVPLYSNVYFDFYPKDLQNYNITDFQGWAFAIPYAYFAEEPLDLVYLDGALSTGTTGDSVTLPDN